MSCVSHENQGVVYLSIRRNELNDLIVCATNCQLQYIMNGRTADLINTAAILCSHVSLHT